MQQKLAEVILKTFFYWCVIYIGRLHSFRDINETPGVIDTNYPWYGGATIYKKYMWIINGDKL